MTPGVKTTEFWLTLLGMLSGMVGQHAGTLPAPWGAVLAAVLPTIYTVARTLLKAQG